MSTVKTTECDTNSSLETWERRFLKKIYGTEDVSILDAYTLPNDICVLYMSPYLITKNSDTDGNHQYFGSKLNIEFTKKVSTVAIAGNISGKKKKGAMKIRKGDTICSITLGNENIELKSPIGGQILEINENVEKNVSDGTNYICVILRNVNCEWIGNGEKKVHICYSFLKDECTRGDKCKFAHKKI